MAKAKAEKPQRSKRKPKAVDEISSTPEAEAARQKALARRRRGGR